VSTKYTVRHLILNPQSSILNPQSSILNPRRSKQTRTSMAFCATRRLLQLKQKQPVIAFHHKLPKRIILLRHGESLGNLDETLYAEIPDWRIPLTRRGERQAERAAKELHSLVQNESLFTYCSPYTRTQETWKIMHEYLRGGNDLKLIGTREEPRIAEQQFGNFQVSNLGWI
jgi:hypothetical protein